MEDSTTSIVVRDRQSQRVMALYKPDAPELRELANRGLLGSDGRYSLEPLVSSQFPRGLPGRDEFFPTGLIVTIPEFPRSSVRSITDYVFRTEDMSPMPLINCLIEFGPEMFLVAGELNTLVYSVAFRDTLFRQLQVAREAHGGTLPFKTQIVCGPVAMVDEGTASRTQGSILSDLVQHPDVELFYSHTRQKEHFRLAPYAVYTEGWHPVNGIQREGHRICYDEAMLLKYQEMRVKILSSPKEVSLCRTLEDITNSFVFLTRDELSTVSRAAVVDRKAEDAFDYLTRSDIVTYLKKLNLETALSQIT